MLSCVQSCVIADVHLENFRSLKNVRLKLEPLTVLVGPNGSGKSTMLLALQSIQRALITPKQALLSGVLTPANLLPAGSNETNILLSGRGQTARHGWQVRVRIQRSPEQPEWSILVDGSVDGVPVRDQSFRAREFISSPRIFRLDPPRIGQGLGKHR